MPCKELRDRDSSEFIEETRIGGYRVRFSREEVDDGEFLHYYQIQFWQWCAIIFDVRLENQLLDGSSRPDDGFCTVIERDSFRECHDEVIAWVYSMQRLESLSAQH